VDLSLSLHVQTDVLVGKQNVYQQERAR
jgi:hypothetical protein